MAPAGAPSVVYFSPYLPYDVLAYCALAGPPLAKVTFEGIPYPNAALVGDARLPALVSESSSVVAARDSILSSLASTHADLDAGLSTSVKCEIKALNALIRGDLAMALLVARFEDDEHYNMATRARVLSATPFPFGAYTAWSMRRDARKRISAWTPLTSSHDRIVFAKKTAGEIYKILEGKLAANPSQRSRWLLGTKSPTSADATLFGHIAEIRTEPFLYQLIATEYPELASFYENVRQRVVRSGFAEVGLNRLAAIAAPTNSVGLVDGGNALLESTTVSSPPTAFSRELLWRSAKNRRRGSTEEEVSPQDRRHQEAFQAGSRSALMFAGATVLGYLLWTYLIVVDPDAEELEDEHLG